MNWRFIDKHFSIFRNFLEKNHFAIKEKLFSPKSFGNAYIVLVTSNIEIRLTKDRDRISVEMRGKFDEFDKNSKWSNLDTILEFIGFIDHTKYPDHLDYSDYLLHLNQIVVGLEKKYMEIQKYLNSPEFLG